MWWIAYVWHTFHENRERGLFVFIFNDSLSTFHCKHIMISSRSVILLYKIKPQTRMRVDESCHALSQRTLQALDEQNKGMMMSVPTYMIVLGKH